MSVKEVCSVCLSVSVKDAWPVVKDTWPVYPSVLVKEVCPVCLSESVKEAWPVCFCEGGMAYMLLGL